jgi:hypothetical protein
MTKHHTVAHKIGPLNLTMVMADAHLAIMLARA